MILEYDGEAYSQFEEQVCRYADFFYSVRLGAEGWDERKEVQLKGVRYDRDATVLMYQRIDRDTGEGSGLTFEVNIDLVEYVYVY